MHAKQAPVQHVLADQRKKKNYVEFWSMIPIKDPFRLVLSEMRDRLFHTREVLHHCLSQPSVCAAPPRPAPSRGAGAWADGAQRPGPRSVADDSLSHACAVHFLQLGGSRGRTRQARHVAGLSVHARVR